MERSPLKIMSWIVFTIAAFFVLWFGGVAMYNSMRVWSATTAGEAQLAEASQNRRIAVLEAQAALDSANLSSQAEIARARGVSEANKVIADGLGGPEGYLRYLYIQAIEKQQHQVIYIPTEAGLPILEAGRLQQ
jgi:hypothetical protein